MTDPSSELDRNQARLEIVEGLQRAIAAGGALVDEIAKCPDNQSARDVLMSAPWSFTEMVAHHILDMPYRRTIELHRLMLDEEGATLRKLIQRLQDGSD